MARYHDVERRFWTRAEVIGECWEWRGHRQTPVAADAPTYGIVQREGRRIYAHRHAYELVNGPIPPGFVVRHTCDNPPCINPAHLEVGTQAENIRDAVERGRHFCPVGERNPGARITREQAEEVRRAFRAREADGQTLADRFGIARSTVYGIAAGRSWAAAR